MHDTLCIGRYDLGKASEWDKPKQAPLSLAELCKGLPEQQSLTTTSFSRLGVCSSYRVLNLSSRSKDQTISPQGGAFEEGEKELGGLGVGARWTHIIPIVISQSSSLEENRRSITSLKEHFTASSEQVEVNLGRVALGLENYE